MKRPLTTTVSEINPAGLTSVSNDIMPHARPYGASFDINSATTGMTERAMCSSIGRCGEYQRLGLNDGGINTRVAFNNLELDHAYKYETFLSKKGFSNLGHTMQSYTPKAGDIMVFGRTSNHLSGHVQMFNGTNWVSDFIQQTPYPWSDYRRYTIFRW